MRTLNDAREVLDLLSRTLNDPREVLDLLSVRIDVAVQVVVDWFNVGAIEPEARDVDRTLVRGLHHASCAEHLQHTETS